MGSRNDRGSERRVCFLTRELFNLLSVSRSLTSFKHASFRRLLYDTAVSYGADIRRQACVVEINPEDRSVILAGGETLQADVIIAADGPNSLGREQLTKEEGKFGIATNSSGLMMFK
jgi:2-polyprenyl-6-methoxyphenol hydroxylase-like FAD-dependent oxidoreductase